LRDLPARTLVNWAPGGLLRRGARPRAGPRGAALVRGTEGTAAGRVLDPRRHDARGVYRGRRDGRSLMAVDRRRLATGSAPVPTGSQNWLHSEPEHRFPLRRGELALVGVGRRGRFPGQGRNRSRGSAGGELSPEKLGARGALWPSPTKVQDHLPRVAGLEEQLQKLREGHLQVLRGGGRGHSATRRPGGFRSCRCAGALVGGTDRVGWSPPRWQSWRGRSRRSRLLMWSQLLLPSQLRPRPRASPTTRAVPLGT